MKENYCILCDKEFVSKRNLKIHEDRLHQVCQKPNFICNFCNTGFEHYPYYEAHFSARLKRTLAKKSKKKKNFEKAEIDNFKKAKLQQANSNSENEEEEEEEIKLLEDDKNNIDLMSTEQHLV